MTPRNRNLYELLGPQSNRYSGGFHGLSSDQEFHFPEYVAGWVFCPLLPQRGQICAPKTDVSRTPSSSVAVEDVMLSHCSAFQFLEIALCAKCCQIPDDQAFSLECLPINRKMLSSICKGWVEDEDSNRRLLGGGFIHGSILMVPWPENCLFLQV